MLYKYFYKYLFIYYNFKDLLYWNSLIISLKEINYIFYLIKFSVLNLFNQIVIFVFLCS